MHNALRNFKVSTQRNFVQRFVDCILLIGKVTENGNITFLEDFFNHPNFVIFKFICMMRDVNNLWHHDEK